ncbi:hypothetical protein [Kitasatospora viridis]|uniref:hypothetical protein n=1 Tax=Kitasatospora viridis TaxID=281105 RepID=UPI001FE51C92|nr:hypothetical protein [Kitasatospora viridis]
MTGIAVVAPTAPASLAAAEAVRVWSATLRTRRVIVCAAEPDCGNGAGFPAQRPERFRGSAQCAGAAATAATVRQYLERGDTVLALGAEGGWEGCVPVVDVSGARALQVGDPERLSFVQRPCAPVEEVAGILAVLRARFPMLRGQHPDQWCYRSSDRGRGIRAVVESSDLVLASEGDLPGPRSVTFGGLESLTPELLAPVATLGVIAPLRVGAAGGDATDAVIDVVGGLGPLSVVHHRSVTSVRSDVHARASRGS